MLPRQQLGHSRAQAQEARRTYRIGVISPVSRREAAFDAFFDELHRQGFIDGANLSVDGRFEVGTDDLGAVATDVVKQAPDAIVCIGTVVVRAGQRATATIPILAVGYDLLGSNLISSLAHPGGNTTGVSIVATELDGKRQEILMELLPGAHHMAALADPHSPYQLQALRGRRALAASSYPFIASLSQMRSARRSRRRRRKEPRRSMCSLRRCYMATGR